MARTTQWSVIGVLCGAVAAGSALLLLNAALVKMGLPSLPFVSAHRYAHDILLPAAALFLSCVVGLAANAKVQPAWLGRKNRR